MMWVVLLVCAEGVLVVVLSVSVVMRVVVGVF
jgi:hypothetical protein